MGGTIPHWTRVARRAALGSALVVALCCHAAAAAPPYPNNTRAPAIKPGSGARQVGQLLTADRGRWETAPSPARTSFTYAWLRCRSVCAAIPGANRATYRVAPADAGRRLRLRVTANCSAPGVCRSRAAHSAITGVVLRDPRNESLPEITGDARRGERLLASVGFWRSTSRLSFSYQWLRCDPGGNGCVTIPAATAADYLLAVADIRRTLRVTVTARGASGRVASATSRATAPVARSQPARRRRRGLRMISPFPKVVVAGVLTPTGLAFREFSIRAPRRVTVRIRCSGRGCPFRRRRVRMRRRRVRVRSLERPFGAGAVIKVLVTRRGFIGKYSRFRVRQGRVPKRLDRCLRPRARRPSRCPRRR